MGRPGPISDRTYERGFRVAAAGGLAAAVSLFWIGPLSPSEPGHLVATGVLFPVYLLSVAVGLGLWLGYDTDERDLRRVTADDADDDASGEDPGWWRR